jgi:hypothetical protein
VVSHLGSTALGFSDPISSHEQTLSVESACIME